MQSSDGECKILGPPRIGSTSHCSRFLSHQIRSEFRIFRFSHLSRLGGTSFPYALLLLKIKSELRVLHFSYLQNPNFCGSAPLRLCVESAFSAVTARSRGFVTFHIWPAERVALFHKPIHMCIKPEPKSCRASVGSVY